MRAKVESRQQLVRDLVLELDPQDVAAIERAIGEATPGATSVSLGGWGQLQVSLGRIEYGPTSSSSGGTVSFQLRIPPPTTQPPTPAASDGPQ